MYSIWYGAKFKKDMKKIAKGGYNIKKFQTILQLLANGEPLPVHNKDHTLTGN